MNKKQKLIVVGMDFSPLAIKALEYAVLFAEMHDAKILAVFAIEPPHDLANLLDRDSYNEAQEKAAEKAFEKLIGKYETDNREIVYAIDKGRPHIVLLHALQEHNAEMMILGSHGQNHREPVMGTVASKMLRSADCPVVVVPEEVDEPRIKKVMLAVDREFGIREIRRFLRELPRNWDIRVVLSTVVTRPKDFEEEITEAEAHLAKQKAALEKLGFDKVETEIIQSEDIIIGLVSHAEKKENEIDLIMMETHGRKGLSHFFIGSITEQVVMHANVPVFSLCPERRQPHYPTQWQFQ